jgi:hypothetical protein
LKKHLIIVCLVGIIVLLFNACKKPIDPVSTPTELIKNGNIETEPYQDWLFGFYYNLTSNPNGYAAAWTTEAYSSGTHALKIDCSTIKNDTTFCFFTQNIRNLTISQGSKLTLKAKIKTVGIQGQGISLDFIGYKQQGLQNKTVFSPKITTPIIGTTDFREYTVTLEAYPGNTDVIAVYLFYLPKTTGVVYLDDVSLIAQ